MQELFNQSLPWLYSNSLQMILTIVFILLYYVIQRLVIPKLGQYVEMSELKNNVLTRAISIFRLLYGVLTLAIILFIWGFDFKLLLAISSGIIALTGVALFASWSILSNITAFFILIIHESYKRGNFIRIIEADNYVEGYISEINLLNTQLISENQESIIYPNNLLIARPTVINPKLRYTTVGKIQEFLATQNDPEPDEQGKG